MKKALKNLERNIGGLKFAVFIISLFALAMTIGTFLESYYGTDFANRMIYKTWWFMFIQFLIFLSIIFAATLRLPPKKRLYGFYTIHSGLIIIGIGSLITYIFGIDGQITLASKETNRTVILSKDVLKATFPDEKKQFTYMLPYKAFSTNLNEDYEYLHFSDYLPFADTKTVFKNVGQKKDFGPFARTSRYLFKNAFAEAEVLLTLHPEASKEFQSTQVIGPLSMTYLPITLFECFKKNTPSKIIFWNSETAACFTPEEKHLDIKITSNHHRFIGLLGYAPTPLVFFPDNSPYPIDAHFRPIENSPIRTFSKIPFEKGAHLFLFGNQLAFFSKDSNTWHYEQFEKLGSKILLPWMGAEISLLQDETNRIPVTEPFLTTPIQKNGQMISGGTKAVRVTLFNQDFWVTNNAPLELSYDRKKIILEITKETINLPFELTLDQFKMDKDPGTMNPASYESFIKLFNGKDPMSTHHVYMNHPLKMNQFTLYQASYSQDDNGHYASTLAVNVDQGRPLKYLGSLMLVLGAIWHYNLNKMKAKGQKP